MKRAQTLWSPGVAPNAQMLAYTIADDRVVDTRLLRWDIIGSLGHIEALFGGGIISKSARAEARRALLAALAAVSDGKLTIGDEHEDGHSAVEFWLTKKFGDVGERIHAGRSRNDQVATDVRLYLKEAVLAIHSRMTGLASVLVEFSERNREILWPGYTHQRIAMPSSAGLWAGGFAEGLLDAADSILGFWHRLNRCPLGSAAGYGVPLPLAREAAAEALGFSGIDQIVTTVQNSRGKLEAAVLFWCLEAAHECAKLSSDVILYSADEFGWIILPDELSTGSSIMPQKRNPDLFELTRARAALLQGDLAAVMALKAQLPSGYHRDFQMLKVPVFRGIDTTMDMLGMMGVAIPRLGVEDGRGMELLEGEALATDEVMRRVRKGVPFRRAYREVAAAVKSGEAMPLLTDKAIRTARSSTGNIGNLGLVKLRARLRKSQRWALAEQKRFDAAIAKLTRTTRR